MKIDPFPRRRERQGEGKKVEENEKVKIFFMGIILWTKRGSWKCDHHLFVIVLSSFSIVGLKSRMKKTQKITHFDRTD